MNSVITRTFGFILIVYTLAVAPDRFISLSAEPERSLLLVTGILVLPSLIPLAIGLALFFMPATISRAVTGSEAPETGLARQVQPLIIGGIGLYLALTAILDLIYYAMLQVYSQQEYAFSAFEDPATRANMVTTFAQLALGLAAMLGGRGLSGLLRRIRQEE